jgi:hypothetical protein
MRATYRGVTAHSILQFTCSESEVLSVKVDFWFTYKRGSAEHYVKDDFTFLWKHLNFGFTENRHPITDRNETLYG